MKLLVSGWVLGLLAFAGMSPWLLALWVLVPLLALPLWFMHSLVSPRR